jgi:hypothetical protein
MPDDDEATEAERWRYFRDFFRAYCCSRGYSRLSKEIDDFHSAVEAERRLDIERN